MSPQRRSWVIGSLIAGGAALLLFWLPLFHVVPLRQAGATQQGPSANQATFEAATFVDQFWTERLIPGSVGAVDASELVAAIDHDPRSARKTYGHQVGLGNAYYYFVAGIGQVVSAEKNSIGLSLEENQSSIQVSLEAGNIFGNSVRDGTGLLDINHFANSQDFNAVSSEINRRIEREVLPSLREKGAIGAKVRFVGCTEITDEEIDLHPLRVVPFIVETP